MGQQFADQYSFLHFSVGVVAYFSGVKLGWWLVLHTLFELGENSPAGMQLINRVGAWPGGKPQPDSMANIAGGHGGVDGGVCARPHGRALRMVQTALVN